MCLNCDVVMLNWVLLGVRRIASLNLVYIGVCLVYLDDVFCH